MTNKSRQYLAVKYPFEPLEDRVYVLTIDSTVNCDFKIFSSRSGNVVPKRGGLMSIAQTRETRGNIKLVKSVPSLGADSTALG